ncbi:hypothetical protein Q765_05100 [Flavobacterium rivuli WB 3.3-2 = DSM 21788]|uniref:Lipoprotein n=1 Tax=Flavobacterium rivuli WB 3.3-2 = DSM 21788 TaxID=1121895 RepID=A0A0A2M8S6_9FLAO|nr:hypothetical protein [Flavobacterium rivuli]KGO87863.1 hypothetical protein Q765_05100 [Flavobacterium rivuli WB 3.3-2 = DSM 21788]
MSNLTKFLTLAAVTLTVACGKTEEKAPNTVLLNNEPETKVYKEELASLLEKADPSKLEYYFDHYVQKDGIDYLYVNITGAVDAIAVVTVREWDEKLKELREFKGKGYGGSEFKNLKLEVERNSANTSFVYKGMDGIAD